MSGAEFDITGKVLIFGSVAIIFSCALILSTIPLVISFFNKGEKEEMAIDLD